MAVQPSVISEDLISGQGVGAVNVIAENLNRTADRAANAARQRAQIEAETKMQLKALDAQQKAAEKELEAKSLQYKQYQEFQAAEGAKERDAQMAARQKAEAAESARQQAGFAHSEKLAKRSDEIRLQLAKAEAENARRSASEVAGYYKETGEGGKLRRELAESDDTMAALELELAPAQAREEFLKGKGLESLQTADAARLKMGQHGNEVGAEATARALEDATMDLPSGMKGFVKSAATLGGETTPGWQKAVSGASQAVLAPMTGGMSLVWEELSRRLGRNVADIVGADTPVEQNALTNLGMFGEKWVENVAPKIVGTNGSPADVRAALSKMVAAGVVASQAYRSDGAIKGADEEKVVAEFEQEVVALSELVGHETVQGLMEGLSTAGDAARASDTVRNQGKELTDSEKKAQRGTLEGAAGIHQMYKMVTSRPGSPAAARDYKRQSTEFISKLLDAAADSSLNVDEFKLWAKKYGLTMGDVETLAEKLKEGGGRTPKKVMQMIEKANKEQRRLERNIEAGERSLQALGLERSMGQNAETIDSLLRGF